MAPLNTEDVAPSRAVVKRAESYVPLRANLSEEGLILEAWGEGWNVGALIILILIVFCNYRRGNTLHKLILLELLLALAHGTFIFAPDPVYGWYLSSSATLLFFSYQIHNVVSWLKIRPFLPLWGSRVFIFTLVAVQPFWVAEAWSNFEYFNNLGSDANTKMRPWECLVRDPWWIFTTWRLIHTIGKSYGFTLRELININTRFGVMLGCMFVSIAFILADIIVTLAHLTANSGINPYWRIALVFKCAADCFFLDDFKTVLDQISQQSLSRVHQQQTENNSGGTRVQTTNTHEVHPPDQVTASVEASGRQPSSSKWRWARRLSSSSRAGNAITVHREMTVTSERKRPHSFNSDVPLVPQMAKTRGHHDDGVLSPTSLLPRSQESGHYSEFDGTPKGLQTLSKHRKD
ncbi:hypothetical protein JX266_000363 [Neoarthrinium moseri]|nr:hypothetical protein JX266_000363 [Neoarthrinium moseri]